MSEKVPQKVAEVLAALAEKQKKENLPKCDRCGSQLRKDDKCICIQYIVEEKKE